MGGFSGDDGRVTVVLPRPADYWEAACWTRFGIRRQDPANQYPEGHWEGVYRWHAYQARHGLSDLEMLDLDVKVIMAEVL